MKQRFYLSLLPLILVSCHQKPSVEPDGRCKLNLQVAMQAPVAIGTQDSKLAAPSWASFANGDQIGLQLVEWEGFQADKQSAGAMVGSGNHTDNHLFRLSAEGWSGSSLVSPVTWRKFAVYGYYPYRASVGDLLKMEIKPRSDQSAGIESSDFLLRGVGETGVTLRDGADLSLSFTHLLTHLRTKVTLPSTYGGKATKAITSVTVVGTPLSAQLNMESGVVTASLTRGEIKMDLDGDSYQAVVIPCSIATGDPVLKVDFTYQDASAGSGSLLCYAPAPGVTLAANTIHTISLSAPDLSFSSELFFATGDSKTLTVEVVTNMPELWSVTSSATWLTVTDGTNQSGDKTVSVTAAKNITGLPRIGKLTLSNGKLSRDLAVRQN